MCQPSVRSVMLLQGRRVLGARQPLWRCRSRQPAPIQGFWIVPDILGPTMVCVTSTYECLIRPLL